MVIVEVGVLSAEKSATDESTQAPALSPRFPAVSVAQKPSVSQTPLPGVKDPGDEGVVVQYMSACAAGANRRKVNPKAVRATPIANFPLLLIKALSTCKMAERN